MPSDAARRSWRSAAASWAGRMARMHEGHRHDGIDRDHHEGRQQEDVADMAGEHEPAGADDDRRHDQHEAGAGVGGVLEQRAAWPPRRALSSARRVATSASDSSTESSADSAAKHEAGQAGALHRRFAGQPQQIRGEPGQRRSPPSARRRTRRPQTISAALTSALGRARPKRSGAARRRGWRRAPDRRRAATAARRRATVSAIWPSGQRHRARRIEVEAQRLVDRHLQRRRRRPAAQRQHDGEGGDAEHEDEAGDARQRRAQHRPFDQPEGRARRPCRAGSPAATGRPAPCPAPPGRSRVASGRLKNTCATRMPDRP